MKTRVLIGLVFVLVGGALLLQFTGVGTQAVWNASQGGTWLLPLVSVSALIDSINPCAFSILLLTIAFLFSLGRQRKDILAIGGTYIAGIFVVYVLIGLGILQTLHLFNTPHFMAKVGASILILFGILSITGELFPAFPVKLRIPHAAHGKMAKLMEVGSLPAAFGLGALVGVCEFPCTGGPYLMILGLLHDSGTYVTGLGYLALYNLIFVLPLAVILFAAGDERLLAKAQEFKRTNTRRMRLWGGAAMVALGLAIFAL